MGKIELEILGLSSSQSQSGSFALVLGEKEGNRRLPIIIGMFEAQAIAVELEKMKPSRPMTHDLFKDVIVKFGIELIEIRIDDLKEGIYFAKIVGTNTVQTFEFDARPSDAIALAVRFGVPIYTNAKVMNESGISPSEFDEKDSEGDDIEQELHDVMSDVEDLVEEGIMEVTVEDLEMMLEKALAEENYEEAARLRDEINNKS